MYEITTMLIASHLIAFFGGCIFSFMYYELINYINEKKDNE